MLLNIEIFDILFLKGIIVGILKLISKYLLSSYCLRGVALSGCRVIGTVLLSCTCEINYFIINIVLFIY